MQTSHHIVVSCSAPDSSPFSFSSSSSSAFATTIAAGSEACADSFYHRPKSSTSSGSTLASSSRVATSMSTHFTRYSFPPPSVASLYPTTASATPYSSPASKSATRSSATHSFLTHSLPPSFHSRKYSLLFPFPLPSTTLSTSAHSYIAPSSSVAATASPTRLPSTTDGVTTSASLASSSVVLHCPSTHRNPSPSYGPLRGHLLPTSGRPTRLSLRHLGGGCLHHRRCRGRLWQHQAVPPPDMLKGIPEGQGPATIILVIIIKETHELGLVVVSDSGGVVIGEAAEIGPGGDAVTAAGVVE